ncbi:hypothetical protein HEB94_009663 [Actinopolymorpha pittospori]|uniref:Uncharacterized protein n=1 Tax=Actinopolymorpha pittospori TaxID=648752 RepID=A0A927N515_9ACTN|nr:hypothetical protein [Actinopolymorpha pittospori]
MATTLPLRGIGVDSIWNRSGIGVRTRFLDAGVAATDG